jgi:hypothetical protein
MACSRLAARSRPAVVSLVVPAVVAIAACGDASGPSGPPAPPAAVQATALGTTSVRVTWQAASGASGYVVERTAEGLPTARTPTTAASLDDAGLSPSTTYRYAVASVRGADTSAFSAPVTVATRSAGAAAAYLRGDVTASRTLAADTQYILSGFVKVRSGATLTVPAGTRLVGDTAVAGSSLWITRGARIVARGTATNPIVFTSQRAPGSRAPGDWGGVVIVGAAPTSRSAADALTHGRTGTTRTPESYGGGSAPNDDSGVLSYVRIEFAGGAPAPGDEQMAALSLYAVGRGTTIEYVQSLESLGSAFQWFGGTVDARHLVSYEAGDDHFSWSEGYTGRNQFVIAFQTHQPIGRPSSGLPSTTPRGIQGYGCDVALAGCASYLAQPLSEPVFANFTLVGPPAGTYPSTVAAQANGVMLRRGSGATLLNGVVARWPGIAFSVREAQTDTMRQREQLFAAGMLLAESAAPFDPAGGAGFAFPSAFPSVVATATPATALFASLPTAGEPAVAAIDWTPPPASALATGGFTQLSARTLTRTSAFFGGQLGATTYRGAADPGAATRWWAGWTSYARN